MESQPVNQQKRCPHCGETKPATTEHFHRTKTRPDGLYPYCKQCNHELYRAHYEALKHPDNLEKLIAKKEQHRRYRQSHAEQYREYQRRDRARDRQRFRGYERRYEAAHPEKMREKYRLQSRRRRANNPEKYRATYCILNQRRRAAGTVKIADWRRMWVEQSNLCAYCNRALLLSNTEVDHIRPVSRGGTSDPVNLCLACRKCNRNKFNKTPEE